MPAGYGAAFLLFGGAPIHALAGGMVVAAGAILWIGYLSVALRRRHLLPARVLWLATLMLNSLALLLSIGGAAFLGLWCVILWQLSAIALSIVGLREQRF